MKLSWKKDSEIYRGKKERVKSIALKAKKESSDDETLTSGSDDEEYVMADHLKMEMEMEIPSSSNVKLITECSDTTYTCYEVMKDLINVKEYERVFMCKTAKDIWQSLLITHQGSSQVKDNKIDLLVQQYGKFTILEEESIDSGFARFNTIITSLKALDEGFSSNNFVRKFLKDLHPKWRAKVTAIEESKDLSSLALDELIGNLKVHEIVMENNSKIYKGKKERVKSIALKAKKESSDDETSTSRMRHLRLFEIRESC
ncbi:hypothetical protein Tco_0270083 [Tanacetum coccineum]